MTPLTPLKRILMDEGRRQSWLAERTGIDQADISRIVRGGMHPGEDRARRIAQVLGRTVEELGWTDDVERQAAA